MMMFLLIWNDFKEDLYEKKKEKAKTVRAENGRKQG